MSLKALSLGRIGAVGNGITISGSTNATPIVVTLGAGHGLENGDRIAISGITGNTNANGEFELAAVTATTAQLVGSTGNGAHGGTAAVSVLCDKTPHMMKHTAVVTFHETLTGTAIIEGSDDNVTFVDVKKGVPLGANPSPGVADVELRKYMRLRASVFTSGNLSASILA